MLETLVAALLLFAPKSLDAEQATLHASSALAAEQVTGIEAELLLSMAWVESRYNPNALSYRDCSAKACHRQTGVWLNSQPPRGAKPSWYCGVLQVGGWVPWEECHALREDIPRSYITAAEHIRTWMRDPHCRLSDAEARLDCALRGYSGGYKAIDLTSTKYTRAVRGTWLRFKSAVRRASVT